MSNVCDHHEIGKFFGTKTGCTSKIRRAGRTDFGQLIRLRLPTKQIFVKTWIEPMFERPKRPINALEPLLPLVTADIMDEPIIRLRIAAVVYIHMKWWLLSQWIHVTKHTEGIESLNRIADESYALSRHLEDATAPERLRVPLLVLDFLYQAAKWDKPAVHKVLEDLYDAKPIQDFTWSWSHDFQALTITGDTNWSKPQQLVISTETENFKNKVIDAVKSSLERCPETNSFNNAGSDLEIYTRHKLSITLLTITPSKTNDTLGEIYYRQQEEQRVRTR